MSLALCPQVESQASQHFRPSKTQATCDVCSAVYSDICLQWVLSIKTQSINHCRSNFFFFLFFFFSRERGRNWGGGGDWEGGGRSRYKHLSNTIVRQDSKAVEALCTVVRRKTKVPTPQGCQARQQSSGGSVYCSEEAEAQQRKVVPQSVCPLLWLAVWPEGQLIHTSQISVLRGIHKSVTKNLPSRIQFCTFLSSQKWPLPLLNWWNSDYWHICEQQNKIIKH